MTTSSTIKLTILALSSLAIMPRATAGAANVQSPRPKSDMVVAADGSGDYRKVQDAIDAVPQNASARTIIFIRPGVYKEKFELLYGIAH